jgi:hypothetical protein
MKKLTDYIQESQQWMESPGEGDTFGIELEDDTLLETYVLEVADDGSVLLDSTEEIYSLLESWNMLSDDIDTDEHAMEQRDAIDEIAPLAALAGGALARQAGAGAVGQMAGRMAGHSVGQAIDRRMQSEPVNEFDLENKPQQDPGEYDEEGDMAKTELHTMIRAARKLIGMLDDEANMPEWTQKKITKATDYVDTAADYISSQQERGVMEQQEDSPVARAVLHRIMMAHPGVLAQHGPERVMSAVDELADRVNIGPDDEIGTSDVSGWTRDVIRMLAELPDESMSDVDALDEAEYQGRKVELNKPSSNTDGASKSKVYVKDPKTGNIKKVTFGDPNMRIRKSNPGARKSFRARHNCDNPGPKTKARYWSCRAW